MPDSNNLNVMHPLAGMPWQRPGGSLPNVHAVSFTPKLFQYILTLDGPTKTRNDASNDW